MLKTALKELTPRCPTKVFFTLKPPLACNFAWRWREEHRAACAQLSPPQVCIFIFTVEYLVGALDIDSRTSMVNR